jgi:hypothetical protein
VYVEPDTDGHSDASENKSLDSASRGALPCARPFHSGKFLTAKVALENIERTREIYKIIMMFL